MAPGRHPKKELMEKDTRGKSLKGLVNATASCYMPSMPSMKAA